MKNGFVKFLYEKGFVSKKDNLYIANNAFKINAIIKWCMKESDPAKLASYVSLIEKYLSGSIDMCLENDKLIVQQKREG